MSKILKTTLQEALKVEGLSELPQKWDGTSEYSRAIIKIDTKHGEAYAIAVPDKSNMYGMRVIQKFHCGGHQSKPLAIYPTSFIVYNKEVKVVVDDNNDWTLEQTKEEIEKERVMQLQLPLLNGMDEKIAWLKEKGVSGLHLYKAEEAVTKRIKRYLYEEQYNEPLTIKEY